MDELAELVENEEMPLPSYLWSHWDAKLKADQKESLINWAQVLKNKLSAESE